MEAPGEGAAIEMAGRMEAGAAMAESGGAPRAHQREAARRFLKSMIWCARGKIGCVC